MSVTVRDLPVAENIDRAMIGHQVHIDDGSRRRKQRRYVKLHQDEQGYFIVDRWKAKRRIQAIRVLAIDGELLNCGTAVLERENEK